MQIPAYVKDRLFHSFIENFVPRFVPGSVQVYSDDESDREKRFDDALLKDLGVTIDSREKMPALVLHYPARNWLLLAEFAAGNGPIDEKRLKELARLFNKASPDLIYITAFQNRSAMADHDELPAWGTHAWFADEPEHMIHFNGSRFLGPYS